ncbi:MAG: response regulator [Thermosynechococcaceae cyanobacterium]
MSETILVIEDERLTRTNLVNFLKSEGFETLSAENGRLGIQLALENLPDLIICDIMMPELDGYDVLTTLQHTPNTSGIPFIFLTITADEAGEQQSLALGADDYLCKPITSDSLRRAIAAQLKKQPAQMRLTVSPFGLPNSSPMTWSTPELQSLMIAKDQLSEEFYQTLLKRLTAMRYTVERLQGIVSDPQCTSLVRDLQEEFTQLLGFANEVSVLQNRLTPNNGQCN